MTMTTGVGDAVSPVARLTQEQSRELLGSTRFGRLASLSVDGVRVAPIAFALDGDDVLLRTTSREMLLDIALDPRVALEIDSHGPFTAWSVGVRGTARILVDADEIARAERSGLEPLVTGLDPLWVRLTPTEIVGRHYMLD